MGVLETRNLDFDHVLLLSCNEGFMPRGVNDTSFIPYAIRKAYGLTTIDHKVAIYQHYFHRLLQRAHDVTLVYNNATTDAQKGEMSRFMLQLMVEREDIIFHSLKAGQLPLPRHPKALAKTTAVLDILHQRFATKTGISPTAINSYLRCQLRFFYLYVCNLQEPDTTDDDEIDNRLFGIIFHQAAQTLYKQFTGHTVTAQLLDALLNDESAIPRAVDDAIRNELFKSHGNITLDGLQLINREVIIRYLRLLVETDRRLAPFTILGLEQPAYMPWGKTVIGGVIDRLDCITDPANGQQRIRVVDYKTGSRLPKPMPDVDSIFDPAQITNHSDYYLQAFLYSHIVQSSGFRVQKSDIIIQGSQYQVSPALLFIQHAGADGYDPTLCLGREPVRDIAPHSERFITLLDQTVRTIFDASTNFTPTDDRERCKHCPYAALCGR
jgi:hypothetical protein